MQRHSILKTVTAVCATWLITCAAALCQVTPDEATGKVVGLAYVGRMVADLERSIAFYKAVGFSQDSAADSAWHADRDLSRLYGVHGIQVRTAKMFIVNEVSGQRFAVYLRQLKGIKRRNLAGHAAWELGATHFSLVVPDAQLLWSQLQAAGMLRARSWGSRLIAPPGQTKGRIAYLTDPDGLDIELLNRRPTLPQGAAGNDDPDARPGVGHAGIVVLDMAKARAFYGDLLGGQPQKADYPWLKGDFFDSVVGGHGNIMRVYDESFAEAAAPEFRLNFALIEFQNRKQPVKTYRITDIGVGYVGFKVTGLDDILNRARATGAKVVSDSGPVTTREGTREVMMRDPDVGGFVELFEEPKG